MASVSPSCRSKRHAVDGLGDAVAGAELHVQVVDLEQEAVTGLSRAALAVERLDVGLCSRLPK